MACNRDQLDERIGKIVAQELNPSELEPWICQTDESAISAVGGRLSLRVASGPPPFAANDHRQLIYLTFSEEPETPVSNTCWIRIPENIGKVTKHQQHFQTSILPRAIASLQDITANCRVLVTSPDESVAVGVGLSILVAKYDDNGEVRGSVSRTPVTKESIKRRLEWIIRDRPSANPPRWMLRRINEYFMSPGSTLV
jgi:tRNA A64-2'-O-ribosylphosphate transferase